jgi:beta-glucosidase
MKKFKLIAIFMAVILIFSACSSKAGQTVNEPTGVQEDTQDTNQGDTSDGQQDVTTEAQLDEDAYLDASLPTADRVASLISQMSLMEKAGQMLQGERNRVSAADMTNLRLGSVLSGGGSVPGSNSVADWNSQFQTLQKAALKSSHKIPMIYGLDAVHGLGLVKGAVVFPHNVGLGAANDPELMYQMGAAVAEEMKLVNILWNFAPCVAVSGDPRWGRTYESFSSDPAIVASLAEAYTKGQQDHGVLVTAKHYVGDGDTDMGTGELNGLVDRGNVTVSEDELRAVDLTPYKTLVDAGTKIVMASFSSYQGVKMHEQKYLLTDVLKGEFGFKGFVVSDWEGLNALSGSNYQENVALAVNAGVDMLMEPNNYQDALNAIINNVNKGKISEERINDAVSRILTVKFDLGMFEDPLQENTAHEVAELGSEGYRDLAKQLVEKSLVLLKNDNGTLPLKQGQKVFVTGPALNDMGLQIGGWGLQWQGQMDNNGSKTMQGTTILEGLQEYAKTYGFEIITDESRASDADVVILGIGEVPYAEYQGDTTDLSITGAKAHPLNQKAIDFVKGLGKPTVTLIVAGRNVLFNDYMDQWNSIVMCYLPGTEGDGIASVLSGETPFTGKLAMPYYKSVEDIGKEDAQLLFDLGYGLTY